MGELVLVGESGGRDGLKPGKKGLVGLVALNNGVEGVLGELVVVAVVAVGGGSLRKLPQVGLVLLVEKCVLGGDAVGHWFEVLGKDTGGYGV